MFSSLELLDNRFQHNIPYKKTNKRRFILDLLKRYAIQEDCCCATDGKNTYWNGEVLNCCAVRGDIVVITHEIAHFLVATKEQRKMKEWGLGSPTKDDPTFYVSPLLSPEEIKVIETRAGLVTLCLLPRMAFKERTWKALRQQENILDTVNQLVHDKILTDHLEVV